MGQPAAHLLQGEVSFFETPNRGRAPQPPAHYQSRIFHINERSFALAVHLI